MIVSHFICPTHEKTTEAAFFKMKLYFFKRIMPETFYEGDFNGMTVVQ